MANDTFMLQTGELSISEWHIHYSRHPVNVSDPGFAILRVTKTTPDTDLNGGFLFLNRRAIPLKHFFKDQDLIFEKKVRLKASNVLNVFLYGTAGAAVRIDIRLEDAPDPPPIIRFEAAPLTITLGDASTLSWQTENAESVTLDNGIGSVASSGSTEVVPVETTTYTITATGPGGTATAQTAVTVAYLPPEVQISVTPDTIAVGESAVLTWSSDWAESCVLEPDVGSVGLNGSLTVAPSETTTYKIIATGQGGESTDETVLCVTDPTPTVEITTSAQTIILGETATLSWASQYAAACTIEPGIGVVVPEGSVTVAPTETTTYTITATGSGGSASSQVGVAVEYPLPSVTFSASHAAVLLGQSSTLTWSSSYADTVEIDQGIGTVEPSGTFEISPGATTTYTLTASGPGGTSTVQVTVTVTYPIPTVVTFEVQPQRIIAGNSAELSWNTTFADTVSIEPEVGSVQITGTRSVSPAQTTTYALTASGVGGTTTETVAVTVVQPPTVALNASANTIYQGETVTLTWTSSGADAAFIDNGVGSVSPSGYVTISPEHTTIYTLAVTGTGGSASVTAEVHVTAYTEPQPEDTFGHLYNDQIPADATVEGYDEQRFAMIVGEVQDINGLPIEGVLVSICKHPEYGTATTDAQGQFSLPVEGGSFLTVGFKKQGLITTHRQVDVPWNDFAIVDTVTMIAEDPAATTVTFDRNPDTVVIHRSTPLTDEFGTRSTTMVLTGDNQAYLTDENGNAVQALDTITTRATVYPVPESMPAVLPPNSAFTFCAELAVDGAQRVSFSKPVITWVENYLGFDVGEIVPVGYYDRDRGVWAPSDNGKVVRLLDMDADGVVDALDADGDGQADDLNSDGSVADEVSGLGNPANYAPDATFWRFAVTHFTPWDCNWPYGPPEDAISPNPPVDPDADAKKEEDCKGSYNSFVEERSRILHEDIPIPGTDMKLHYASNRVEGYKKIISIHASGHSVPNSLKMIIVKVKIAGRRFKQVLDPLPDQKVEFVWDGLDYLGNEIQGSITADVSIGFVYNAVYYSPSEFVQSFAQVGDRVTTVKCEQYVILWKKSKVKAIRYNGNIAKGWTLSSHHRFYQDANSVLLFRGDGGLINNTIYIYHYSINTVAGNGSYGYSGDGGPADQAQLCMPICVTVDASGNLYIADYGSARVRKVDTSGIITTIAGNGNSSGAIGDGGPAIEAMVRPHGLTVDASGNLYIADYSNYRVRKVDTSGIITTVAGNGVSGCSGDGGPAIQAQLRTPDSVAVDAYGNLYIADPPNHRIRKVDTNGIITTIVGTGSAGYSGDGSPGAQAQLNYPNSIAVDASGNVYISDGSNYRIRRMDVSGIITTVAGTGISGYSGDGGLATQAQLGYPYCVVVDALGNLYISDKVNNNIRKVNTSGIITTVAGTGISGYSGDGGPAVQAQLKKQKGIAVDASGNLYIADDLNFRIRKVAPAPGVFTSAICNGDFVFTGKSGLGNLINTNGLHKSDIDFFTGVVMNDFSYDQEDRLVSIADHLGNEVVIERSADGIPTAIISPYGLRTELTIDNDNHLVKITYQDGSDYGFEYTNDGLLIDKIDPNENHFPNNYNANGRLVSISDDEGGIWQYSRTVENDGDILIEKLSAEGNLSSYLDHTDTTGAYTSVITNPTGNQIHYSRSEDGLAAQKTLSCGMSLAMQYDVDSVYKFDYLKQLTETTPSLLEKDSLYQRSYLDTDADDIPDQITQTETMNGKATTILTDTSQSRKVITSPEGREVTALFDSNTLLTTNLSIPGLYEKSYGYDSNWRVASITTGARQTSFTYDGLGNLASVTDPANHTTIYWYDAIGRITSVDRPDGSSLAFSYDYNGNMTLLSNPLNVDHKFTFNGANFVSGYQAPISGNYSYVYDKDRNLIQTNFPSGKQINNIYTAGQLTQIQTPEGKIDLTYSCGSKLESVSKAGQTIEYAYDGKLLTDVTLSGTLNQSLSYTYNNDFDVTGFTYAGETEYLGYDLDGLLTESGGYTIARNAGNGLPESVSGNGITISRTFNGYGELDDQIVTTGSQTAIHWNLTRDNAGRIITKTETAGGETHSYAYNYDAVGRLLTVTRDGELVENYTYDLSGTRISETNTLRGITNRSLSYSDEDHLLTAGDAAYTYDLDGFLTSKTKNGQVTTYYYLSRGELLQVQLPDGGVVSYDQDPLGRRIAKRVDGVIVEKYLWQGLTKLLAVYDGFDTLIQRFEYADGRMPVAMTQSGDTYFLAYDQVGSLRIVTDASGNVFKRIDYDTFGNILTDSNPTLNVPFGFAGGLHDRDTGLVRFGRRDYDPDTGRWTAKDPIGFAGGDTDLYGYVLNNPINFVDPTGEFAITGTVALGFLAAKAIGIGVAWVGLQTATHAIGNPALPSDDPCGDYHLSNFMNDVTGGLAVFNTGLGVGIAGAEVGAALYPELMIAAGTPQGQKMLSNATDFISSAIPSTAPTPNLPGLAGHIAGEAYNAIK